jgi:hypothetical protein
MMEQAIYYQKTLLLMGFVAFAFLFLMLTSIRALSWALWAILRPGEPGSGIAKNEGD